MPGSTLTATGLTVLLTGVHTSTHSQFHTESGPNSFTACPHAGCLRWDARSPDRHPLTSLPPVDPHRAAGQYRTRVSLCHPELQSMSRFNLQKRSGTRSHSAPSDPPRSAGLLPQLPNFSLHLHLCTFPLNYSHHLQSNPLKPNIRLWYFSA